MNTLDHYTTFDTEDSTVENLTVRLNARQAVLLNDLSRKISDIGGIQSSGALEIAAQGARELTSMLEERQAGHVNTYKKGRLSSLVFEGLHDVDTAYAPSDLPSADELENHPAILMLGARNQILLNLLGCRSFSYDIDNEGKQLRLVANFKGGGLAKLNHERQAVELSSHSGLSLGPHTEAPYWCSNNAKNGHSPAPSALILSAMWNPGNEPTTVIPVAPVLSKIGPTNILCLTSNSFKFTRSDSFNAGQGEGGCDISILDFDPHYGFSVRFNSYRFSVGEKASGLVKRAYAEFCNAVSTASNYQYVLSQRSALVINNTRALHCRDVVKDNRRLLVRVFGYSRCADPIVLDGNHLLVKG